MKRIKSLVPVLVLGMIAAIYAVGATQNQPQSCGTDSKAGCCAAMAAAENCCVDGAECCKAGAECCKSGSEECKSEGSCCAAHHKTRDDGEAASCPTGKDGASCCAQGKGCGDCCKAGGDKTAKR